jgi:hypothetical protein
LYHIAHPSLKVRKAAARMVIWMDLRFTGKSLPWIEHQIPGFMDDDALLPLPESHQGAVSPLPEVIANPDHESGTPETLLITSHLTGSYREAQLGISERWAIERPELTLSVSSLYLCISFY